MKNFTKIVCTLGPASDSVTEIEKLVIAGMNVARLNFSHGSHENHLQIIKNIKKVEKKLSTKISILQDLQGPKIRVGEMPEKGIIVKKGQTITFSTKNQIGQNQPQIIIPIDYKKITKDITTNEPVLIDDGLIEGKITKIEQDHFCVKISVGGTIKRHKGVNFPLSKIKIPAITVKDFTDIDWGIKNEVDFIALSFVKKAEDIRELKQYLKTKGATIPVIAKFEQNEAVKNMEEIVLESDGIMVARGDLALETKPELVPLYQKQLIYLCNIYGKPVITATQVLQSMVENPLPTRAEVSDAANAVFDHTDAIMLSNESAVGKYPTKAVKILCKIACVIEKELKKSPKIRYDIQPEHSLSKVDSFFRDALSLCNRKKPNAVILMTNNGKTARNFAKLRPYFPVTAICSNKKIARQLPLIWGIKESLFEKKILSTEKLIRKFLEKNKINKKGEKIVILANNDDYLKEKYLKAITL